MTTTVSTGTIPATGWGSDPYAEALRTGRGPLFLRRRDGWLLPMEVERWCAAPDAADRSVLDRCRGPVLDIGCGPGRLVAALAELGRPTLGVDVSPAAVARTVGWGGSALCRSVFDPLPSEGHWGTALLLDGNVGIGGGPRAFLSRVAELLAADGLLMAEAVPVDVDERVDVRVVDGAGTPGEGFPWARLGLTALMVCAADSGWSHAVSWTVAARTFAAMSRC